jgi:hypothetical protein
MGEPIRQEDPGRVLRTLRQGEVLSSRVQTQEPPLSMGQGEPALIIASATLESALRTSRCWRQIDRVQNRRTY